ncbi:MAG: TA system VapC family ribonuclease toxin [Pseudomonadota bacterium]|jgi:toxin-antitoxin system PIN domain toxin|nr:PIN domain-containing protein [Xanthomonadaceae bacterium]
MRALLDINVLIALLDADHIHHGRARDWLSSNIAAGWASCPLTQNGYVRVVSQPAYPKPLSPAAAIGLLREACATRHHAFWPDDASILDEARIDASRIHGPRQLTDVYLLALAQAHGGRFVTFDAGVPLGALRRAAGKHLVQL